MKKIRYDLLQSYAEDNTPILMEKTIDWSEDGKELAKREAYNGDAIEEIEIKQEEE